MIDFDTVPPSEGGCWACWCDERAGMLVKDDELGVWVHQHCLDFFGVDNCLQFERQYFDI